MCLFARDGPCVLLHPSAQLMSSAQPAYPLDILLEYYILNMLLNYYCH
jgi:hypothetical protein